MTKRLVEFVEGLERDELVEVVSLANTRYKLCASIVWDSIEMTKDIFLNNILAWVSRAIDYEDLYELRFVSKKWFLQLKLVEHIKFPKYYYRSYDSLELTKYFTQIQKISAGPSVLERGNFSELFRKVIKLEISAPLNTRKENWDITNWTSLKTLVLENIPGSIIGLSQMTSLTYLECDSESFVFPDAISRFRDLSTLIVSNFPQSCPLSTFFPKLTYLESDCPHHFSHFTGKGKLDTEGAFYVDDFAGEEREMAQRGFDAYVKNCTSLRLSGEWVSGIFSGDAHIGFPYVPWLISGPMLNGKLHGLIQEGCSTDKESFTGYYENGLKHGKGIRRFYQNEKGILLKKEEEEEEWNHGFLLVVKKEF